MAEYAALQTAFEDMVGDAGLVVAPNIQDPEKIPGRGAGSWVTYRAESYDPAGADGSEISVDRITVTLGMVVLAHFNRRLAQKTAADLALTLRKGASAHSSIGDAGAQVTSTSSTVELSETGERFIVLVTCQVAQGVLTS